MEMIKLLLTSLIIIQKICDATEDEQKTVIDLSAEEGSMKEILGFGHWKSRYPLINKYLCLSVKSRLNEPNEHGSDVECFECFATIFTADTFKDSESLIDFYEDYQRCRRKYHSPNYYYSYITKKAKTALERSKIIDTCREEFQEAISKDAALGEEQYRKAAIELLTVFWETLFSINWFLGFGYGPQYLIYMEHLRKTFREITPCVGKIIKLSEDQVEGIIHDQDKEKKMRDVILNMDKEKSSNVYGRYLCLNSSDMVSAECLKCFGDIFIQEKINPDKLGWNELRDIFKCRKTHDSYYLNYITALMRKRLPDSLPGISMRSCEAEILNATKQIVDREFLKDNNNAYSLVTTVLELTFSFNWFTHESYEDFEKSPILKKICKKEISLTEFLEKLFYVPPGDPGINPIRREIENWECPLEEVEYPEPAKSTLLRGFRTLGYYFQQLHRHVQCYISQFLVVPEPVYLE